MRRAGRPLSDVYHRSQRRRFPCLKVLRMYALVMERNRPSPWVVPRYTVYSGTCTGTRRCLSTDGPGFRSSSFSAAVLLLRDELLELGSVSEKAYFVLRGIPY